jgi:hypothetical protein
VEDDALANPTATGLDGAVDNLAVPRNRYLSARRARTVDQGVGIIGACSRVCARH